MLGQDEHLFLSRRSAWNGWPDWKRSVESLLLLHEPFMKDSKPLQLELAASLPNDEDSEVVAAEF